MNEEPITKAGQLPPSGTGRFVSVLSLELFENDDGTREGLELRLRTCFNPDCSCTLLFVKARAFDEPRGAERVFREPNFELTYDVEKYVLAGFEAPRTAAEAGFQSALRSALRRKATKALLRREFEKARARLEPVADPTYDFSAHADGVLAAYHEVYPSADYLTVTHEGTKYAFDDQWCVRPDCACRDGVIDLLPLPASVDDAGHEVSVRSVGAFSYPTGEPVERRPRVDAKLIAAALDDRARAWLAVRRERLRAEAARRWPVRRVATMSPEIPTSARTRQSEVGAVREKVGRNERCPCGSGKKFKQCCLRTKP